MRQGITENLSFRKIIVSEKADFWRGGIDLRKVRFTYKMELQFDSVVHRHFFSLRTFPMRLPEQQICGFSWALDPAAQLTFQQDCFGNTVGAGCYMAPHHVFCYQMDGVAWIDPMRKKQEPCLACYRYPSAACQMTDGMALFLRQCNIIQHTAPLRQAEQLMQSLHEIFSYRAGVTTAQTTAGEAFALGCGVCQDYAQILIALCRASGIAARYVAGCIVGEGASHAWVEVYSDGLWHGLDPTQNKPVDDGYLKLAHGRDHLDCQLNRGIFCGNATQQQYVSVNLEEMI